MPCFIRMWTARQGHEDVFSEELIRAAAQHRQLNPHVIESLMYRQHAGGQEFIGLAVFEDEEATKSPARLAAVARMDELARLHTVSSTPPLRIEMIQEFASIPPVGAHGMIALFHGRPEEVGELIRHVSAVANEAAEWFTPTRLLIGHDLEARGLLFFLVDSMSPVNLEQYLQSPDYSRHFGPLERFFVTPARWYALDPIARYFRGRAGV